MWLEGGLECPATNSDRAKAPRPQDGDGEYMSSIGEAESPSSALLLYPFLGEGSPTIIDYRKKGTLSPLYWRT